MEFANIFRTLEDGARSVIFEHLGVQDVCPGCGRPFSARVADNWRAGRRIHCVGCDWTGSWRAGTILSKSTLSCSQFLLLRVLVDHSGDNQRIADFLGIHPDTVKAWRGRTEQVKDVA